MVVHNSDTVYTIGQNISLEKLPNAILRENPIEEFTDNLGKEKGSDDVVNSSYLVGGQYPPEKQKFTWYLLLCTFIAALPSFGDGFSNTVVNNSAIAVRQWFKDRNEPLSDAEWSLVVALFPFGATVGALFAGWFINRIGAHKTQLLNNGVYITSGLLCLFTQNYAMLIVGRFIGGIGIGINGSCNLIYIQECSTKNMRGPLSIMGQFIFGFGSLMGLLLGIDSILGTIKLWRVLYCLNIVPAVIHLCISPFLPESPRTLYLHGHANAALKALERLRGTTVVQREFEEYKVAQASMESKTESMWTAFCRLFTTPSIRYSVIACIVLPITTPFACGYFVVYFSNQAFEAAGLKDSQLAGVYLGIAMLCSSMLSNLLVNRVGRKNTLNIGFLFSGFGGVLFTVTSKFLDNTAVNRLSVVAILMIALFGFCAFGVQLIVVSELFPTSTRAMGVAVSQSLARLTQGCIAFIFPLLIQDINTYAFLSCPLFGIFNIIFILFMLPETSGLTMEEIQVKIESKYVARVLKSNEQKDRALKKRNLHKEG